jgi:hypothetical protein
VAVELEAGESADVSSEVPLLQQNSNELSVQKLQNNIMNDPEMKFDESKKILIPGLKIRGIPWEFPIPLPLDF